MKTGLAISAAVSVVASQIPGDIDVIIRYAVQFGGAFAGCVVVLLPFVLRVIQRLDRQDDVLLAVHDRLDRLDVPLSPGRLPGQAQRSRSGRFKALQPPTKETK